MDNVILNNTNKSELPEKSGESRQLNEEGKPRSRPQKSLSAEQAAAMLAPFLEQSDNEECWIALLDSRMRITSTVRMSEGTADACPIDAEAITLKTAESGAAGLILCHSHPSGNASPSTEDITETIRLRHSLSLFGIRLADHIIFAGGKYFSFYKGMEADIHHG